MEFSSVEPRLSAYLHAKAAANGIPLSGTFELTSRCNFNCRMCYVHLSAEEQRRRGEELTADEWLAVAEQARSRGMLFLLLTGGEPLVRPDFKYLLTELKKMGLLVSVNSNGSLINDEWLEFFKKEPPFRFNITLYGGNNETYERLCGRPMFDTVVGNIRSLKEIGIDVKMNVSLTPDNASDIEKIYDIANELNVPVQAASYMFPPIRRDESLVGENERFTAADAARCSFHWDELRFEPEIFRKRIEMQLNGDPIPQEDACVGVPGEGVSCRAGSSTFWMDWQGSMMPCGMMTHPKVSVKELGFDAAWQSTMESVRAIRLPSECASCTAKNVCHSCAAMCLAETGKFSEKPQYLCDMTRETIRLFKESI